MLNKYSLCAILFLFLIIASYVLQFYFNLGYSISSKPSDWVDFSDYVTGLTSPVLSFVSLVLLIHSLNLQNEANTELRAEVKQNYKNEQLRSFESYFFGLIEAQKSSFSNFKLEFSSSSGKETFSGVRAIQRLEDEIQKLRDEDKEDSDISQFIEDLDQNECIFNSIRSFYNIVKMSTERLSDNDNFDERTRKMQFETLINFTEFSQLRLVMISIQFMDWYGAKYLKSNEEFMVVFKDLGGGDNLY